MYSLLSLYTVYEFICIDLFIHWGGYDQILIYMYVFIGVAMIKIDLWYKAS